MVRRRRRECARAFAPKRRESRAPATSASSRRRRRRGGFDRASKTSIPGVPIVSARARTTSRTFSNSSLRGASEGLSSRRASLATVWIRNRRSSSELTRRAPRATRASVKRHQRPATPACLVFRCDARRRVRASPSSSKARRAARTRHLDELQVYMGAPSRPLAASPASRAVPSRPTPRASRRGEIPPLRGGERLVVQRRSRALSPVPRPVSPPAASRRGSAAPAAPTPVRFVRPDQSGIAFVAHRSSGSAARVHLRMHVPRSARDEARDRPPLRVPGSVVLAAAPQRAVSPRFHPFRDFHRPKK